MNIRVIRPEELSSDQINAWCSMMRSENTTDSPFFHPGYAITLSRFREPVRVAVVTDGGKPVAFFPFEQQGRTGRPLGIKLCDFQGIVSAPGVVIDVRELLAGCGLTTWKFDHVAASHLALQNICLRMIPAPYADLSAGFDAYVAERKRAGTGIIQDINGKRRKLERDIGPIRFTWHSSDRAVFETLLEWKSAQRKRTGTFDILQFEWVVQALDVIREINTDEFGGVLSTLYVNDTLAAVFLSMRTRTVLHHWFPAYNIALSRYSPGLILHLSVAQAAAERGLQRLDFGKGDDRYKKELGSGSISVGEGAVDLNPLRHIARNFCCRICNQVRDSRLREPVQIPKRIVKNFIRKKEMRSS